MKEESFASTTYPSRHRSRRETTAPKFYGQKFLRQSGKLFVPVFAIFGLMLTFSTSAQQGGGRGNKVWGDRYKAGTKIQLPERSSSRNGSDTVARYRHWNEVAINASGLDHTPVPPDDPRIFGEQVGPGRSSRAMAIVHIAMFDAINAILGGYESFTGIPQVNQDTSIDSAIAQAAHLRIEGGDDVGEDRHQHEDATDHREKNKFDSGINPAFAAPHADQEVHGNQDDFPEQVEQEKVERCEYTDHPGLEHQHENEVFLRAIGEGP